MGEKEEKKRKEVAEEITSERVSFPGEGTREYDIQAAFQTGSARSEVSMDAPQAREETKEVMLPDRTPRAARKSGAAAAGAHWPQRQRPMGWFREWLHSDPVVQWFLSLPDRRRRRVAWAAWILATASMIVGIFLWSTMGVFPVIEHYIRPLVAPRPLQPLRHFPREGAAFDLVENRELDVDRFVMGEDCIWIAANLGTGVEVDREGLALLDGDTEIASLDLRRNWDGLIRIYFQAGEVTPGTPLHIRIPIVDGGMWRVFKGSGFRVLALGGPVPPRYVVGPVVFKP